MATNLGSSIAVALVCAAAFWQVDYNLSSGVLQRMGFLFLLGSHFLLTGLAAIGSWRNERLLYFRERGVGCYSTLPFVLSRTFVADAFPMRILPALLVALIVYPSVGLAGYQDPSLIVGAEALADGYKKAGLFVLSLCLTNLVGSSMFTCIGIVCSSAPVAVLVGTLYSLYTLLFSGFLANSNKLPTIHLFSTEIPLSWLTYLSCLYYNFELVMSNELLGRFITVTKLIDGGSPHELIQGEAIVNQYLGFNNYSNLGYPTGCPWGGETLPNQQAIQLSACWFDIYVPLVWFIGAVVLSVLLLKYCVRESH